MHVGGCKANQATYRMMADGVLRIVDFEGGLKVANAMLSSKHCPRLETFLLDCGAIDMICLSWRRWRRERWELKSIKVLEDWLGMSVLEIKMWLGL